MMACIPPTEPILPYNPHTRPVTAYHHPLRISTPYNPQPQTSMMYGSYVYSTMAEDQPYTPARNQLNTMTAYIPQTQTSMAESRFATMTTTDQPSSAMAYGSPTKPTYGETQPSPMTMYAPQIQASIPDTKPPTATLAYIPQTQTPTPTTDSQPVCAKTYSPQTQSTMGRSRTDTTLLTLCNALCYDAGDAYIIFEACLRGELSHVSRRPHERERKELIKSGSIFVFEENASGMKRWTDGLDWSASRIAGGNFLVYRELPQCGPGEKKKLKRKRSGQSEGDTSVQPLTGPQDAYVNPTAFDDNGYPTMFDARALARERNLVGSLDESYGFKQDGLIKKTMSMTFNGVMHHLVCYYSLSDIVEGKLLRPSRIKGLQDIMPRAEVMRGVWKGQLLGPSNSFSLGVQYPQPQQQQQQSDAYNSSPQGSYYVSSSSGYGPPHQQAPPQQHALHRQQGPRKRPSLPLASQQHYLQMTSAPMARQDSGLVAQTHYEDHSDPALITGDGDGIDLDGSVYPHGQYGMVHAEGQDGLIYAGAPQHGMVFTNGQT